jgi:hypothetical protein
MDEFNINKFLKNYTTTLIEEKANLNQRKLLGTVNKSQVTRNQTAQMSAPKSETFLQKENSKIFLPTKFLSKIR